MPALEKTSARGRRAAQGRRIVNEPISSPHAHQPGQSVGWVMSQVLLAAIPGVGALWWWFGWGVLSNLAIAAVAGIAMEAAAVRLRGRDVRFCLSDGSALVTALLFGVSVPPGSPWWLIAVGMAAAILLAKHLYGGLGHNPFNPAMVGYVVSLISFPVEMTRWQAPRGVDAATMATPLDVFKQNDSLTVDALWTQTPDSFGHWGGYGWEWVNLAFLAGGAYLLARRLFTWHAPVAMLAALALSATAFYDLGSSDSAGSPLFHLLSGATMLGAFFIVTDPVSSATSPLGKLIYGAGAGVLVFVIRSFGNYPDAIAFGVLLMNFAAPLIDHYTRPRVYGH